MEGDNAHIEKLLEKNVFSCMHCANVLKSPIIFVPTKGNICGACHEENENWIGYPNDKFELLMQEYKLACKFKEAGCVESLPIFEKATHEEQCIFVPKKCPLLCTWLGNMADIVKHCMDAHAEKVIKSETNEFVIEKKDNDRTFVRLLTNDKSAFFLQFLNKSQKFLLFNAYKNKAQEFSIEQSPKANILPFDSIYETAAFDVLPDSESKHFIVRIELSLDDSLNEFLLEFIECPICKIPMFPPIWQCVAGHSLCKLCHEKLANCPTCRGNCKPGIRNYFLEKLTEEVKYSCSYFDLGCREELKCDEMMEHGNICRYKSFECIFENCTFNGNAANMIHHFKTSHYRNVIFGNKFEKTITYSTTLSEMQVLIYMQNIFVFKVRYVTSHGLYYQWAIQTIGENKQSYFKITLCDVDKPHLNVSQTAECVYGFQPLTVSSGLYFSQESRDKFSKNNVTNFQLELDTL